MELDAAVMDGQGCQYGAVMALPNCRTPVAVAQRVMQRSVHNVLVGEGALQFAVEQGFRLEDALEGTAAAEYHAWAVGGVISDGNIRLSDPHDTIGLVALAEDGRVAAATSTSGWRFCHPGRVGDSPIVGSGLYADNAVG